MNQPALIPHLFRTEFRKITSVLIRMMGISYMESAEDIASETFLTAMETWPYKGVPENPVAWLYAVARNKARNHLMRQVVFQTKIQAVASDGIADEEVFDWSEKNIADSQLQMLFAVCHPAIPPEAQIGLALRILCGFGIEEIADAFLTTREAIQKRLYRAREKLREEKVKIDFPDEQEIKSRLAAVLKTLYLLFSEGYYSQRDDHQLQKELCLEAMRLAHLLVDYPVIDSTSVYALLSLMSFHASRFDSRISVGGEMILYDDQDEGKWNQSLVEQGVYFLHQASRAESITPYHLEAAIAFWHTKKEDPGEKPVPAPQNPGKSNAPGSTAPHE